ncbi:uncharacterized protein LOC143032678 [Oratosquilla oratoria]|uniref:uncharacterized protein LOC143032678 n=1 Tax=Oratosquilla oratoria TaxID=337810 RepID=UPI003F75CB3D
MHSKCNSPKRLRSNKDITVRRADKAAVFVLISTDEYVSKIDDILMDSTKFKRINRDPTLDIIRSTNKTIDAINAKNGGVKLTKISGDFKPGYLYGNVKTHKPGNPLRPIISQIPTPTYNLAKFLNQLLTPLTPTQHSYVSSKDFLDSINDAPARGIISSLDVESHFTNVPILRTINYICDAIYRTGPSPKLDIPEIHLRRLLEICTMETAFQCPRGNLYQQVDGVAMGSPLGVLFAHFFMG